MRADHIRKYIPYLTIAAGIICALFYKCRYGYAVLDEAFYPTIGYRFSQGDAVLYEEWSNTQLYGVLMVPIIRAYIFVNGSTEGIYLFFRYLYTLIKIIFSIFVYFRLIWEKGGIYGNSSFFDLYSLWTDGAFVQYDRVRRDGGHITLTLK